MARSIRLTTDEVITSAKLKGVPPALALGIWQQESGAGANTKTSPKGAVGEFQVTPPTFQDFGPKGGSINNPVDNMEAGLSKLSDCLRRTGGDWESSAQCYYRGSPLPKGVQGGPNSGPGTPDTQNYGQQVVAKARQKAMEYGLPTEEEEGKFQNPTYNVPRNGNPSISDYGLPPNNPYATDEPLQQPYNTDEEGNQDYQGDEEDQNEPDYTNMPQQLQAILGNHTDMANFTPDQNMIPYDRFDPAVNMIGSQNYDMDKYIRRLVDEEFKSG